MEIGSIAHNILLFLHLIGMAIIVGGYLVTVKSARVLRGMLHASYLQLATGIGLIAVAMSTNGDIRLLKLAIKLALSILVTVLAFIGTRKERRSTTPGPPYASATYAHATFASVVLATLIAVFWK